jgi:adenylate kinase family enzyme
MGPKPYNLHLPFTETYAWENFLELVGKLKQAESMVFFGFGRKIKIQRIYHKFLITSSSLNEVEELDLSKQQKFERVFMSSILKDPNRHFHRFEKSPSRNPDWKKQIFKCIDPDCRHYTQAQFILNKRAACARCGELFIVEKAQIKNKSLVGLCCAKSKKARTLKEVASVLASELPFLNEIVFPETFDNEEIDIKEATPFVFDEEEK